MKRDCMETRHNVSKKRKTEQGGTNQTVVGRGCNIGKRHDRQLQSLISLIPSDKSPLQVTEDRLSFLQQTGSCMGIYMEWLKKKDSYFLWGSSAEEGLMIKFEFHGGFEAEPNLFDIKNPLLGFSGGFNSDNWMDVKRILLKVFGLKGGEKPQCEPDYLLAFTRTGEILHLRVFKIHQLPSSECKNQSMKLQDVSPVFILKPLEVHYRVTGGSSEEYTLGSTFFDENRFMFAEGGCLNLDEQIVYSGGSSQPVAPHVLHNYNSLVVLLPLPASPRWIGFNTSCKEFFERYHIVKNVPVPGKGPPKNLGTHLVYTLPMRSFMRTLIMEVGEAFDRDCCFSDFTENNVFLRRGKAAILGVKQVRYTPRQARRNWKVIFGIFTNRAPRMPEDLYCSAYKFIASVVCRKLGEVDPRAIYHKTVNSIGWMDGLDKDHVVSDLYVEFLTFLDPSAQLVIAKDFPDLAEWEKKFDANTLLYDVRVKNLDQNVKFDPELYKAWKESKARGLNVHWNLKDAEAQMLSNGRLYFGNVRHSYTHLPEHGLQARTPLKLAPQQVDDIVSSTLGGMTAMVQERVPDGFPINDPRKSHARFSRYFRCVDEVEFDPADEK